jgi:threonine synthase
VKTEDFPPDIRPYIIPKTDGKLIYRCLNCRQEFDINQLLYTCPACKHVLLIYDLNTKRLNNITGNQWRRIFDYRKMSSTPQLKGIFRYHEFIGPIIPMDAIIYLGEGHTPLIEGNSWMKKKITNPIFFKNDGQNPSASFKDRGMACAFSYINCLLRNNILKNVLAVCASTGDTSAAAALYASYLNPGIKSAVILPHGKITPQQLSQPLGSGAMVFEIPGVFDDCMKVVECLSNDYPVALLNSKNAWRILGQESFSFEIAQDFEYDLKNKVVVLPIGNAGNISAVMSGFIKFFETGIITDLPKIIGVQSAHANPVYRYYFEKKEGFDQFSPVTVRPSVAQAAMIGNPVSMPRVIHLVEKYNRLAEKQRVFFVEVREQDIMDWELIANQNGHIACTHGGESLAGVVQAIDTGMIGPNETAVIDSTAHALKFVNFQQMYFADDFPEEFDISPKKGLINQPIFVDPSDTAGIPGSHRPENENDPDDYVRQVSDQIAQLLQLKD